MPGFCGHDITSITLPDNLTSIGEGAFTGLSNLTNLVIPSGVTSIGFGAFTNCNSLTELTLPFIGATKGGDTSALFGYIFGATTQNEHENKVPSSLKKVTITSATQLGANAFAFCNNLTSIELPSDLTNIGDSAFYWCSQLANIQIPESVTSIGTNAFAYCHNLTIYCAVESKPNTWATSWNSSERPIVWDYDDGGTLNTTPFDAFEYTQSGRNIQITSFKTQYINAYPNVVIPSTDSYGYNVVKSIGDRAFLVSNQTIQSVVIPDSVISIGSGAFQTCYKLKSVVIGNGVGLEIGSTAFWGCSNLAKVIIGNGVQYIGFRAFYGCTSLAQIKFEGTVEEWNNIEKDPQWCNPSEVLTSYVQCSDGQVLI